MGNKLNILIGASAVFFIAFFVHAQSLNYGFTFDEQLLIVDNASSHGLENAADALTHKFWPGEAKGIYYRPVIIISYALGYEIAGTSPWVHHLISILSHAGACVMVFFFGLYFLKREGAAFLAAAIFAVHPVHAENVFWVPGRTDVLAAFFVLSSFLLLMKGRDTTGLKSLIAKVLYIPVYLLAVGSKEIAIVLPAMVILHDLIFFRKNAAKYIFDHLTLIILTIIFMVVRSRILSGPGIEPVPDPVHALPFLGSVSTVISILGASIKTVFIPSGWRIDFAWQDTLLNTSPLILATYIAVIIFLIAISVISIKKKPALTFTIAAFFLALLPVSHIIAFPTVFAERFMYLPGLFLILSVFLVLQSDMPGKRQSGKLGKVIIAVLIFVTIAAFSIRTMQTGRTFKDDISYWRAVISQKPDLAIAHNWLGIGYMDRNMLDDADREFSKAYSLDPDLTIAAMNSALIKFKKGNKEEGISQLTELLKKRPGDVSIMINLATSYASFKMWDDALLEWKNILAIDPHNFTVHLSLLKYHVSVSRDRDKAIAHFYEAAKTRPDDPSLLQYSKVLGIPLPNP